ncbi:MAG: RNA-binding S4 domain-containing protein [Acidobacteria bacterium]|nr:RNA-binding S4 domain-containing protein [Acidobacteriota bacterium]
MTTESSDKGIESNRIDLWLKYVCLFRTRTEAGNAVRGGHVKLNESRVKPSSIVRVDDQIEITRADYVQKIAVRSVPRKQVPRKDARDHYEDHTPQPEKRELRPSEPERVTSGKLNKKDRRELRRLKGR